MENYSYTVILITTNTKGEAQQIAGQLLEQRQAACANVIPKAESRFWWEGKLDSAQESLLIIKTKTSRLPEIVSLVKKMHSNTVPEIVALPIIGGNQEYLEWIDKEVV